jgi:N-acetylneuraminic acid mutarotase
MKVSIVRKPRMGRRFGVLFLFAGIFFGEGSGQCQPWIEHAPLHLPRLEGWAAPYGDGLIVVGGFIANATQGFVATDSVERYDAKEDRWTDLAPFPADPALTHIGLACASQTLYAVGGLDRSFNPSSQAHLFNATQSLWEPIPNLPQPRGAFGISVLEGLIYCSGGFPPETRGRDFARYDPEAGMWETLPPLPRSRESHVALALDGKIYLFGGRVRSLTRFVVETDVFDPGTMQWSQAKSIPTPRGGLAGAVLAGRAYLFGGEGSISPDRPQGVYPEVEEYDPKTDAWRLVSRMPHPRHGMAAVTLGNRIFLPGGGAGVGFTVSSTMDSFAPPPFSGLSGWRLD